MFSVGDKVEVCSWEEGFVGSYYEATIIKHDLFPFLAYHVQYKNLVEEDHITPLTEKVSSGEVRPIPPNPPPSYSEFTMFDKVDVFDNDGWWFGKITGRHGGNRFLVYFPTTGEELVYHYSQLRHHQDWINRNWISSKRRAMM